jgi:fluoroquinolone transport system ATP-binding protein
MAEKIIQVEDLSFSYDNINKNVLKKLNFSINKGEIFGFLGPSGAGKSTTQKILYKLLNTFTGTVKINQLDIKTTGSEYYESIGVGFELPNHYLKLTGLENLQLFASFYKNKKITNFESLFALVGLEDSMNNKVESYSKGMQMRLNYIRAIMHDPDILFFDEPTAGLDPINAKIIKQHILKLKESGKTVFITTHDMIIADQLCDRIALLVDGEIICIDQPCDLKKAHGKNSVGVETLNGQRMEFDLTDIGTNKEFLLFIKQNPIKRIKTLEASLEEVFIKLTGKELKND